MGTLPHVLHTGARPIGIHEFAEALRAISPPRFPTARTKTAIPRRSVALAVSGGVDSMALAYLCSRLSRYDINFSIADNPVNRFHAITIDHKLRPESAAEAKAVSKALDEMGIGSRVCSIYWAKALGHVKHPKELPNFESLARRFRYQSLARTCTEYNIASLLVAHHQDDQYETVLMRLLQGHGARGLRGIRPAAEIPECEGMHGIYRSGYVDDQKKRFPSYNANITRHQYKALKHEMRSRIDHVMLEQELRGGAVLNGLGNYDFEELYQIKPAMPLELASVDIEDGGIMVYRPLLEFSKDRLIATCEANSIPWWEDNTNQDPTLTMRNAVRHMYKNHALPVALQKPSILALSRRCEQRAQALEAEADRLLAQTIIRDVEPNVGSASVQFPEYSLSRFPRDTSPPLRRRARIQRQREVAGLLIQRIISLVSPGEQPVPLANLQNVISRLFPALSNEQSTPESPKGFAIAGVHFIPIEASPRAGDSLIWYLSRTPYPSDRPIPRYCMPFRCILPIVEPDINAGGKKWSRWTRWRLWDGRFWIRVRHLLPLQLPYRVILKPFLLEHAKAFREELPPQDRDRLAAVLKRYAPRKTRYTLPAFYLETDPYFNGLHVPNTIKTRIIALPSLDIYVPHLDDWFEFEIRCRRVDRRITTIAGSFRRDPFLSPRLLRAVPTSSPGIARRQRERLVCRRRKIYE